MTGGNLSLRGIVKLFDDIAAVDGIDLDMPSGEFFSLLGPSGCGKTTTLRMIAGFEQPTAGEILLDGQDLASTPSYKRPVNTVFQSYALFPHLSVADNVAFGLRRQRLANKQIRERAERALRLVQMEDYGKRRPAQLSGGQQQRVALARALVLEPAVLLLDEPLGALDAKLRKTLQVELKALQQQVGITFVYVTHDQEEALTMSDRIAVMNRGKVEQVASPKAMYEEPETTFVADFLGTSNLMNVKVSDKSADGCAVHLGDFRLIASHGDLAARGDAKVVIRPERVLLHPYEADAGANSVNGMVEHVVYLGNANQVILRLPNGDRLQALIQNDGERLDYAQGDPIKARLPADALRLLADTGTAPLNGGGLATGEPEPHTA